MTDYKPFSLSITYVSNPAPSPLTKPFNLTAYFDPNYESLNTLNAVIDTSIQAMIHGTNFELVDNHGSLVAQINSVINASCEGLNDINHVVGVSCGFGVRYKKAIASLSANVIPWAKPILRVSN